MRHYALTLAVIVTGYLGTCNSTSNNYKTTSSQPPEVITILRPVPAILNENTLSPVDATEIKIKKTGTNFEFKQAQFINENCGWVISPNSVYRTTDGGKTWERMSFEPQKDGRFVAFSFIDELHGWLAMLKQDLAKSYGLGYSSVIMITEDGGRSWNSQAVFEDEIQINDIRFLNQNEGLAVGYKGLENRVDRGELFVLGTSNGGKQWQDISGPAKAAFKNQWGAAVDSGIFIQWTSSSVLLLTRNGRVMSTPDRGKTWNTIVIFKEERPNGWMTSSTYYTLVLDPEEKVRVVGGAAGDEGYQGDLVVNEDGRWTSYELIRTPLLDAVFLSDKDVIACGLNVRTRIEKTETFQ